MSDGLFGAGPKLNELRGRLLAERVVGHLHTEVIAEDLLVALEKGPVQGGKGTRAGADGLFGIELAMSAVVGHAIDVGGAGDVGLGGGEAAVGVGGHAEDVRFDDPIVGVDVSEPEPVGELTGREASEVSEVGEDHEAIDVVRPALLDDLGNDGIHAVESGLDAPVDGGEGKRGVEGGGGGAGVGVGRGSLLLTG